MAEDLPLRVPVLLTVVQYTQLHVFSVQEHIRRSVARITGINQPSSTGHAMSPSKPHRKLNNRTLGHSFIDFLD